MSSPKWLTLGRAWRTKRKPYAFAVTLDVGSLLAAAMITTSRGELGARCYLFENENRGDSETEPDFRLVMPTGPREEEEDV